MAKRKKKQEVVLTPEQQREADYQKAIRRMEGAEKMLQPEDRVHMYKEALRMFEELGDYEDSEVRKKRCKKRLPLARREYREEVYQTRISRSRSKRAASKGKRRAKTNAGKLSAENLLLWVCLQQ